RWSNAYAGLRLTALEPRASGWMSKETRCPSERLRIPAASTAVACTNTSLAPPSGEMKPKPLLALKNLTVPIAMIWSLNVDIRASFCPGGRFGRDHQLGKFGCLIQRAQCTVGCLQCASADGTPPLRGYRVSRRRIQPEAPTDDQAGGVLQPVGYS